MPLTSYLPKPLLPIAGTPVLEAIVEKVSELHPLEIGINIHHLSDKITEWAAQSKYSNKLKLFYESRLLGTGGALKNASTMLSHGIFLVHNGDIITDLDLKKLIDQHVESNSMATLAVHDFESFNNLVIDSEGSYIGIREGCIRDKSFRSAAFTGIAVYSSEFMKYITSGPSSIIDAWTAAVSEGHKINTIDFTGCNWNDIGTPSAYASSVADLLIKSGETVYISRSSNGCSNADLSGLVVLEDRVVINQNVSLHNCIVQPDTIVNRGSYKDCLLIRDRKIDLCKGAFSRPADSCGVLISSGGSDRKYYRTELKGNSSILMVCRPDDPDFDAHIKYTEFFRKHKIPVPELFVVDAAARTAYFEDVGDTSLYVWMKCKRPETEIEDMYKKVLDTAVLIHSIDIIEANLISRSFDFNYLRWETAYFFDRFVKGCCKIDFQNEEALKKEFDALATHVYAFSKSVLHRDFQAQNIMIKNNMPMIIDFQGARTGPPAYDIASILWDPYSELSYSLRNRLLQYYIFARENLDKRFDSHEFTRSLIYCRLQRHMQALGAYAFLSEVKGKRYFQKYMPACLSLLSSDIEESSKEFPCLAALVHYINSAFKQKNTDSGFTHV